MLHSAGEILIPTGFVLLFSLLWWRVYLIPLKISLSAVRDYARLLGTIDIGFGPVSIALIYGTVAEGEIRICQRPVHQFMIPKETSSYPEEKDKDESEEVSLSLVMRWIPHILCGVRLFIRYFRIGTLYCHAQIGCGCPYSTGLLYGYSQAVIPLIPERCDIRIIPDFDKPVLDGELSATFLIITPCSLVIQVCRIFLPEMLKSAKVMDRKRALQNV